MLRMRFHYNNYNSQLNNFNDVDGEEDDDDNEEVSSVCWVVYTSLNHLKIRVKDAQLKSIRKIQQTKGKEMDWVFNVLKHLK